MDKEIAEKLKLERENISSQLDFIKLGGEK